MGTMKSDQLKPVGGPFWKNWSAWALINLGNLTRENKIDISEANHRIPVLPGRPIENYNDSFVFQGSDAKGNLIMTRLGFREDGSMVEVWVWLVINGKKYSIVDDVISISRPDPEAISANGLSFLCHNDEKNIWQIRYSGPLSPGIQLCEMDVIFTADAMMYHSGMHMDVWTFAKSMAEMPWSRDYFKNLSSETQCRIEQGGTMIGKVVLDGNTFDVNMLSIRDHSWGKRNWAFMRRYIWNILCLEDDLVINHQKFRYLVYTTVNYGTTFRHLVSGWIGGKDAVLPIVEASDMAVLGEDGRIPEAFESQFRAKGGPVFTIKTKRSTIEHSWLTQNNQFEICEAHCTVSIGGITGYGMSEFGYVKGFGYSRPFEQQI